MTDGYKRWLVRIALLALALVEFGWLARAWAAPPTATSSPASLPELPELQPIQHPPPSPDAVKDLEARLSQLLETSSAGPLDDKVDLGFLTADLDPTIVPAIAQRIQELRNRLDGDAAEQLLEKARKAGKKALRKAKRDDEGDWLAFVLALQDRDSESWQGLTELYALLRMLETVGTTPAVRELIGCYSYFGELVRIDLQRAVARLRDRAVPALIEARKHDARRVRQWANRQLDELGRTIPGEAVSTTDPEVLAAVLRAFGYTRDTEAVRVILSFCNSDRVALRRAAREAIVAIGEPATWQLKDTYQTLTGNKVPRDWTWQRTAQELFQLHDHARLAVVYEDLDAGLSALKDQQFEKAVAAFDRVLGRSPLFEGRAEMAPAYAGRATELAHDGKRSEAIELLRKALRIAPDASDNAALESQLATLEAEELIEAGTPDRFLLQRALELDPNNERARELLGTVEQRSVERQHRSQRYVAAIIVGLIAMAGMLLLARRRPREATVAATAQHLTGEEPRSEGRDEQADGQAESATPTVPILTQQTAAAVAEPTPAPPTPAPESTTAEIAPTEPAEAKGSPTTDGEASA